MPGEEQSGEQDWRSEALEVLDRERASTVEGEAALAGAWGDTCVPMVPADEASGEAPPSGGGSLADRLRERVQTQTLSITVMGEAMTVRKPTTMQLQRHQADMGKLVALLQKKAALGDDAEPEDLDQLVGQVEAIGKKNAEFVAWVCQAHHPELDVAFLTTDEGLDVAVQVIQAMGQALQGAKEQVAKFRQKPTR